MRKSIRTKLSFLLCLVLAAALSFIPAWGGSKKNQSPQREALVKLYKATNGKAWNDNSCWGSKKTLSEWHGILTDADNNVVEINLEKNNLCGELPDVFDAFPALKVLNIKDNDLTGELPVSLSRVMTPDFKADLTLNRFAVTTFRVPENRIEPVGIAMKVYPQNDNSFRLFVDSDVDGTGEIHPDKSAFLYQKHTEGAGVDLYIMGDGYDEAENTVGGTADYWFKVAAEAFFDVEPYRKLRKYYDVYFIYAHSPLKGVDLYDNVRDSRLKYHAKNYTVKRYSGTIKTKVAFDIITEALGRAPQDSSAVNVCINSTHNAIGGGVELRKKFEVDGQAVTVGFGITQTSRAFRGLVRHETGGHAQGFLLDEYTKKNPKGELNEKKIARIKNSANLDVESDPAKVKWAQFIADPRYASEEIGVYEGGMTYKKGVYRPSRVSLMVNNKTPFNAPSRAAIYRIVMRKAFPDTFVWDYEDFVKFDLGLE